MQLRYIASLILLLSCAGPVADAGFVPLRPPAPTPPGGLSLNQRIGWWESHLEALPDEDRSEALLRLGELQLEAKRPAAARIHLFRALRSTLSRAEQGACERGIGIAYLMEKLPAAAESHMLEASRLLPGEAAREATWLAQAISARAAARTFDEPAPAGVETRYGPYLDALDYPVFASAYTTRINGSLIQVDRRSWKARPIRSNVNAMSRPTRITVHHSAEPLRATSLTASADEVRRLQGVHQNSRRWADIGYHFLIDRSGRVIEGRPLRYQGAHAGNPSLNRGNIGICVLGNFAEQPERGPEFARRQQPNRAQLDALSRLVGQLRDKYRILRSKVHTHGELKETACPGTDLAGWVASYRRS